MARGQRRFVLAVGFLAAASLGVTFHAERKTVMLEWWRWRAARECRQPGFDRDRPPPPAWQAIFSSGADGHPALAELLMDQDPTVHEAAWQLIDANCGFREQFLEYLRKNEPLATLKYLCPKFLDPHSWRTAAQFTTGDPGWYLYWCGEGRDHLATSAEAIDFLESRLESPDFENRAIGALAAMLKPGEVQRPESALSARIVEIMSRSCREHPDLGVATLLAFRAYPANGSLPRFAYPDERRWEEYLKNGPPEGDPTDYSGRPSLLALCHFDDPWALRVITRLLRDPRIRPALGAILAERNRLGPLEMPLWQPPIEAVRRFFKRSSSDRIGAAFFLSEENLREGKPMIQEALPAETDEQHIQFHRSCLLALGEDAFREEVRRFFIQEKPEQLEVPIYIVWSNLLWSGDLPTLEWVILNPQSNCIDPRDFIDGFPPDAWSLKMNREHAVDHSAWWAAHRPRIAFDPARRKFFVRP